MTVQNRNILSTELSLLRRMVFQSKEYMETGFRNFGTFAAFLLATGAKTALAQTAYANPAIAAFAAASDITAVDPRLAVAQISATRFSDAKDVSVLPQSRSPLADVSYASNFGYANPGEPTKDAPAKAKADEPLLLCPITVAKNEITAVSIENKTVQKITFRVDFYRIEIKDSKVVKTLVEQKEFFLPAGDNGNSSHLDILASDFFAPGDLAEMRIIPLAGSDMPFATTTNGKFEAQGNIMLTNPVECTKSTRAAVNEVDLSKYNLLPALRP